MFSPELMSYLIKYQGKEYLPVENEFKKEKNDEFELGIHRFTKFASIPIKVER